MGAVGAPSLSLPISVSDHQTHSCHANVAFDFRPIRIHVYKNGDDGDPGRTINVTRREFRHWVVFLDGLTKILRTTTAVNKLFTIDGRRITHFEHLEPNGEYVAIERGQFIPCEYGAKADKLRNKETRFVVPANPLEDKPHFLEGPEGVDIYLKQHGFGSCTGLPYPTDGLRRSPSQSYLNSFVHDNRSREKLNEIGREPSWNLQDNGIGNEKKRNRLGEDGAKDRDQSKAIDKTGQDRAEIRTDNVDKSEGQKQGDALPLVFRSDLKINLASLGDPNTTGNVTGTGSKESAGIHEVPTASQAEGYSATPQKFPSGIQDDLKLTEIDKSSEMLNVVPELEKRVTRLEEEISHRSPHIQAPLSQTRATQTPDIQQETNARATEKIQNGTAKVGEFQRDTKGAKEVQTSEAPTTSDRRALASNTRVLLPPKEEPRSVLRKNGTHKQSQQNTTTSEPKNAMSANQDPPQRGSNTAKLPSTNYKRSEMATNRGDVSNNENGIRSRSMPPLRKKRSTWFSDELDESDVSILRLPPIDVPTARIGDSSWSSGLRTRTVPEKLNEHTVVYRKQRMTRRVRSLRPLFPKGSYDPDFDYL